MTARLYLDIETVTVQPPMLDVARAHIKPAANLKDPEKIAADIDKKLETTSLNGLWGQVTAIGYALDDDEPIAYVREGEAEGLIISAFAAHIDQTFESRWHKSPPTVIGHNVLPFDIRFLFQRMIVNGISIPWHWLPIHAKPWDHAIFDTMVEWYGVGGDPKKRPSLGALCAGLGIDVPETLPGAEMPAAWLRGDYEAIRAHVLADVEAVRQVHRRMTG